MVWTVLQEQCSHLTKNQINYEIMWLFINSYIVYFIRIFIVVVRKRFNESSKPTILFGKTV